VTKGDANPMNPVHRLRRTRPAAQPRQSPPESAADARLSGVGPSAGFTAPAAVMLLGRAIRSGSMVGGRKRSCRRD
jgi:hypothetical protein